MPLTILTTDDPIALDRHDVAVCVPLYGGHEVFVECLRSLLEHTPADVPLLISDDASPDDRSLRHLQRLDAAGALPRAVHYVRHDPNRGFVGNVNDAFARLAPADVVVVNSDCVVTAGWLDALRRAAASDTLVATVSIFTNHGTILSLPNRNRPQSGVPQETTGDAAAADIAANSLGLHPRLPTLVGHCFLVTRAALDLVGDFDLAFSPGYGEEVDFAQRCTLHGLVHVLADDAFVVHQGSVSFSANKARAELQAKHDAMIGVRYPYFYDWVRETELDESGPFPRALRTAQRTFRGLTVAIDGRALTPFVTGTQVATLELIVALKRRAEVDVRVVVPDDVGEYARAILAAHDVTAIPVHQLSDAAERADVAHRPYQVSSAEDLELLSRMGNRVVISHLDLIGFNNPGYFDDYEQWAAYRRLSRSALGLADGVAFISRTAGEEAIGQELLPRERAHVVHLGTDHVLDQHVAELRPPRGVERFDGRPFLLCLGTDFRHKNRLFALRLLRALRERHDWDGGLVLAGPHVASGSSKSEEAGYLTLHRELGEHVLDVAAVGEGEKRWLMRNATSIVYPSVHEGFGFVPFEAAEAGLMCIFAAQTSLAELLPGSLALIEKWDADVTADRVIGHLRDPELRAAHVAGVRAASARLTWNQTAQQFAGVYGSVARQPAREARKLAETLAQERIASDALQERFERLEQDWYTLRRRFDETTEHLVDSIPSDVRRPLLALTTRTWLSGPIFAAISLLYSLGYRATHFGRSPRR